MIVLDSSAWIEYFADGEFADEFEVFVLDPGQIVTSVITVYEVLKRLKRDLPEQTALQGVATMRATRIVEVTEEIALLATDISLAQRLAMADSLVLATARTFGAHLYTTDSDFLGIDDVTVFEKRT